MAYGKAASVIEKIDRNFYERFGDVQAFAFNELALEMAKTDSVSESSQQFINTMVSYYVLYDLMMVCDLSGNVIATNTIDKSGSKIDTKFLIGQNFSEQDWFKACTSEKGPEGGAWYSDFMINSDVTKIYNRPGWGMAFAAPIKDKAGSTIGVWYNYANWSDVVVGIRQETELEMKKTQPDAFILITNATGTVIDSDDTEMLLQTRIRTDELNRDGSFKFLGKEIKGSDYIIGNQVGAGAYIYKGKNWNAIALIPKTKFSFGYIVDHLGMFLTVVFILLTIVGFSFYKMAQSVSTTINGLKTNILKLSNGELVEVAETKLKNEIGEMSNAIRMLVARMNQTANFAKQIGEGKLTTDYAALGETDVLGHALLNMRNNLEKIQVEENRRMWANEGLAKFGEILRQQSDLKELSDKIITNLVKYVKANQGVLFLVNDEDEDKRTMELVSAYAWERKKFVSRSILPGEGLIGQCWLENKPIYLTEVPDNYIRITSGLGQAIPKCIIIIPLTAEGITLGAIELASFHELLSHERTFLTSIGETIAATLSTVRINAKTKILLEQSQQQAEIQRSQEEEMRQNMEELSATQEELSRKETEYIKRIKDLEAQLTVDSVKQE